MIEEDGALFTKCSSFSWFPYAAARQTSHSFSSSSSFFFGAEEASEESSLVVFVMSLVASISLLNSKWNGKTLLNKAAEKQLKTHTHKHTIYNARSILKHNFKLL